MNSLRLMIGWIGFISMMSSGCGDFVSMSELDSVAGQQDDRISECDGFEANGQPLIQPPIPGDTAYCDAEVLYWRYDPTTSTLSLTDARILLNCCGEHAMAIRKMADGYLVTQRDWPTPEGRCSCMCVFDFALVTSRMYETVIRLQVVRDVSDWPEASGTVFDGELDLSLEYGQVLLDPTPVGEACQSD